jgi:hypothetical protein
VWALISATGVFFLGAGVSVYHGIGMLLQVSPPNPSRASELAEV